MDPEPVYHGRMSLLEERRYQVFISSTFRDLQEARQKVLEAVLEAHAFPAGMEMFPSADDEQWQFISQEILSSDYYVVIVAGKYGSISDTGFSFTEMEYDFAIQSGKPVMGFLVKDLSELKGAQLEEDTELRKKLLAFREKVQRGKLVKFFRNYDELKTHVSQALHHAFTFKPQEGWVRAKNSRRLEDLEEINSLQKRVMDLEKENAELKRPPPDPRAEFLSDTIEFRLQLRTIQSIAPPAAEFVLKTTFDKVFPACFSSLYPKTNLEEVGKDLGNWAARRILEAHPEATEWEENVLGPNGFERSSFREMLNRIRNRMIGLGFIEIVDPATSGRSGDEEWIVTERGRLYGLTIARQSGGHV
jgi:hypothetical protein